MIKIYIKSISKINLSQKLVIFTQISSSLENLIKCVESVREIDCIKASCSFFVSVVAVYLHEGYFSSDVAAFRCLCAFLDPTCAQTLQGLILDLLAFNLSVAKLTHSFTFSEGCNYCHPGIELFCMCII